MKKLQKAILFLLAAAFLLLLPANPSSVQAAETTGTTYCIKYVTSKGEWRYKEGSYWDIDDDETGKDLYYLRLNIEDGDLVVLEGSSGGGSTYVLTLPVHLSNLTSNASYGIVVTADGIDDCYVLAGSVFAVTGDVANAYIYNNAAVTFHGNVDYMEINQTVVSTDDGLYDLTANVSCDGTVNHLVGQDSSIGLHYEFYSFAAGKLVIKDGDVTTSASQYSTTALETSSESAGTAETETAAAEAEAATAAVSTTESAGAGSETASSTTYTVARGDSLWRIAYANLGDGARYTEIMALSGITSTTIYAGQVLTLPAT